MTDDDFQTAEREIKELDNDELTFITAGLHAALILRVAADTQPEDKQANFIEMVATIAEDAEHTFKISKVLRLAREEKARREN